jgi:hypothetical protein
MQQASFEEKLSGREMQGAQQFLCGHHLISDSVSLHAGYAC